MNNYQVLEKLNKRAFLLIVVVTTCVTLVASIFTINNRVVVASENNVLSISIDSTKHDVDVLVQSLPETTITSYTWGYEYQLENGDTVQVGDNTTEDFKAHVKTIRKNGICDFSIWLEGGTFTPSVDNLTISFDFNGQIHVDIYPREPCERLPEGGVEYDVTLNSKPAQNKVSFNVDWTGITWRKILPLDEEYDYDACVDEWGDTHEQFVLTQSDITGINIETQEAETLKHIEEYEVNSYIGKADIPTQISSGDLGGGIHYVRHSRSYLHIHRGIMTDNLGDSSWVEDIELDEVKKEITFTLPKTWLRNASYPVHQVCGTDPSYTEDMDTTMGVGLTEGSWTEYDAGTNLGLSVDDVAEFIITNDDAGKEYTAGLRTYGSSLDRYVALHEAEGGGATSCRTFVLVGDNSGTPTIEYYSQENTDIIFTLVGYWQNVGFTERWTEHLADSQNSWVDESITGSATELVCHFVFVQMLSSGSVTMGIREDGSSLERKLLVHETEGGEDNHMDAIVKSSSSDKVELYTSSSSWGRFRLSGYFGSELDFIELFQQITNDGDGDWDAEDLTSYLDQDGRVVDFLLTHETYNNPQTLGIRGGDDASTIRYFLEHEAEGPNDDGTDHEYTGFGISTQSNASGVVNIYSDTTDEFFNLMGYFKPAGAVLAISNPGASTWPLNGITGSGVIDEDTIYYANPLGDTTAPSSTVTDSECRFTVYNEASSVTADLYVNCGDFSGGDANMTNSDTGNNGSTSYGGYSWYSGMAYGSKVIMKSTGSSVLYSSLAVDSTLKWGAEIETQTSSWSGGDTSTATMTMSAQAS